jgi:hypothetical protein
MASSPAPVQPQLELEDEPEIAPGLYRYICSLDESPTCYARFFDALLIPKSSHAEFMYDLKTFREQPAIIAVLEPGTKEGYRQCTRAFVGSRFAHPWCRTACDFQAGWARASWAGTTKSLTREEIREEERLHRLLVPIWIAFRRRMTPEQETLEDWVAKDDERQRERQSVAQDERKARSSADVAGSQLPEASNRTSSPQQKDYPELGFKLGPSRTPPTSTNASSQPSEESAAATASQMFLGAALSGFIMSDKRVKKYMKKHLKKL